MTGRRYAVLIGSSEFPADDALIDLHGPANDVDRLDEVLAAPEFGDFAETHLLKNKPHYEVLRTINRVLEKAERDDLVLIYYSGHGKLDGAGRLHLATSDTEVRELVSTSVPVASIRNFIDVSRSTKTALILDCCYSGAVGQAFFRSGVDEQLNLASGGRGTYIMTASTEIQLAKEKEGDQLGLFTKHLIEGIRGGAADRDGDGYVTMNEIYSYVHDHVLRESHQEPMKWDLNVRGDLIISKSGTAPWEEQRAQIRAKLLALANDGVLPDTILSKALQVAAMKRPELKGEHGAYGALLERVVRDDFRLGEFIDDWLKVTPAAAPPSEPGPPPKPPPKPAAGPKSDRQQRPEPAWQPPPVDVEVLRGAAQGVVRREALLAFGYWAAMGVFMLAVIVIAMDGPDAEPGIVLTSLVALAGSVAFAVQRRDRLTAWALGLHWLGCMVLFAIAVTFLLKSIPAFFVTAVVAGVPSGVLLIKWWRRRRARETA